jgi:O-antigen/teichoic acid export membrane protein
MKLKHFLTSPGKDLPQRMVFSGIWVVVSQISDICLGLIRPVILARFLFPEDFGLVGIATVATALIEIFFETGFWQALIQKKRDIERYLSTTWTVSILRGFALFVVLYFAAPLVAGFFRRPDAIPVIQAMASLPAIRGFTNVAIIYFTRELDFRKNVFLRLCGTIASVLVSLSLALILKNVWAIVIGTLARGITEVALSYVLHPYRPKFRVDLSKARELFGFGRYILMSNVVLYLITQGDDILVGRILGISTLGFYTLAYKFSHTPTTQISRVVSRITFPAYARIQSDGEKLRRTYLATLQLTAFASILLSGQIYALAPDFTSIVLGKKWMPMVPSLQALVLAGLLRSLAATTGPVFKAVGKPGIDTTWQVVRLAVLAAIIYPLLIEWGILGASFAVTLSMAVACAGFMRNIMRVTGITGKNLAKTVGFPLAGGIAMTALIWIVQNVVTGEGFAGLVLSALAGFVLYLCTFYIFDRYFNYGMTSLIRRILSEIGK